MPENEQQAAVEMSITIDVYADGSFGMSQAGGGASAKFGTLDELLQALSSALRSDEQAAKEQEEGYEEAVKPAAAKRAMGAAKPLMMY